jgi:peptide/nickel transport system permease protein
MVVRRLIAFIPIVFIVSVLIFLAMRVVPGDPITVLTAGSPVPAEIKEQLRREFDLDKPIVTQYLLWAKDALQGDFGISLKSRAPVSELLGKTIPITLTVLAGGLLVSMLISIPLGVIAALRQGRLTDQLIISGTLVTLSIPVFTAGILAIIVFSFWLGWLPPFGRGEGFVGRIEHMILPWLVLGLALTAAQTNTLRAGMIDVLNKDYILAAEARGLRRLAVLRHGLRTAMVPVVTILGVQFGYMIVGSVLIDYVFGLGGLGQLLVDAVNQRDYPVIQALLLCIAVAFTGATLLVDIVASRLDPRYGD